MLFRAALVLALMAAAGFGVWEVRRWSVPKLRELISPKQRRLRLWGLFLLLTALGLCVGWTYLPQPHTRQELIRYAQYILLICFVTLPLIPLALLDWRENLRHLTETRKKLVQETLGSLAQEKTNPPPTTPA